MLHSTLNAALNPLNVWEIELYDTVGGLGLKLIRHIRKSPYHETDPDKADYFWIPNGGMPPQVVSAHVCVHGPPSLLCFLIHRGPATRLHLLDG